MKQLELFLHEADMPDLYLTFKNVHKLSRQIFALEVDDRNNFYRYSRQPKCSDLVILSLAVSAEAIGLDSENFLYGKIKSSYPQLFEMLPDRTNYNRRKRKLKEMIELLSSRLAKSMNTPNDMGIIDSMPLPVCRKARSSRLKILKEDMDMVPKTGYSPIDKTYFHGYKLHCLIYSSGVIVNYCLTQGNVHDIHMMKPLTEGFLNHSTLIGDKGYIGRNAQLELFQSSNIKVVTPARKNQSVRPQWGWQYSKTRKRIETVFSQFCDQFLIKRNYARKFEGYATRITAKLCAFTALQYINFLNNKPLNQVKYALA